MADLNLWEHAEPELGPRAFLVVDGDALVLTAEGPGTGSVRLQREVVWSLVDALTDWLDETRASF